MEISGDAQARVNIMIDQIGYEETRRAVKSYLELAIAMAEAWDEFHGQNHVESPPLDLPLDLRLERDGTKSAK